MSMNSPSSTASTGARPAAEAVNLSGACPLVLVCEHASAHIPQDYANLGIDQQTARSHAAWDPGADAIAREMSRLLDAALVRSTVSRLVYDCNRPPEARDAIPEKSEIYDIPGNVGLSEQARADRVKTIYRPFEELLEKTLASRNGTPALVTVHSFTPVYFGKPRQVEIGILHDTDTRLADALLKVAKGYDIQRNAPYGPADGVTHTLKRHGVENGYLNVMLEIRNDLAKTPTQCEKLAGVLAGWIAQGLEACAAPAQTKAPA